MSRSTVPLPSTANAPGVGGPRAIPRVLASYYRSVDQTPLGGFLLGKVWPAYFFSLVVLAKAGVVYDAVLDLPGQAAEQGAWPLALWLTHQSISVVFLGLVVVLFVVRGPVVGPRSTPLGAVVAIAGTFCLVLLSASGDSAAPAAAFAVGAVLILSGTVFAGWSLMTLGRCFGLFPEARGLVTRGPYSSVRHPVYLGEMVSALGLLIPYLSMTNVAAFALFCGLQYWRALNEERALQHVFPNYAAYRAKTWRLLPWLH